MVKRIPIKVAKDIAEKYYKSLVMLEKKGE